jgi:PAS domain S-box-containing protein
MTKKPTYAEMVRRVRALEKEAGMYRALADAPFEAIFLSEKGVCLDQNQAAETMFGYAREEAVGRPGTDWIAPGDREQVKDAMMAGREDPYEVTALRKDGTTFPCEIQARMTRAGERSIRVTALRDITERKRAVQRLEDEIDRRRVLVQQSRDGIVVLDRDCTVVEANERFADMLGYTVEEALGLRVWDWDDKFTEAEARGLAADVDEAGHHFETRHRRKDGTVIDVELSNSGVEFNGQKLIFCVCRDVTDRNRAAEERERLIAELRGALAEIKALRGILPICASCKNIRDEKGEWHQFESYLQARSDARFSHSICPDCAKSLYPGMR